MRPAPSGPDSRRSGDLAHSLLRCSRTSLRRPFRCSPVSRSTRWLFERGGLALLRLRVASPDGFEVITWSLWECNPIGLVVRNVVFEENDLARAMAELDERHREIAGDAYTGAERAAVSTTGAANDRDWTRLQELIAPDFLFTSRRSLGFPPGGRAEYIDMMRNLVTMAPDLIWVPQKWVIAGYATIMITPATGSTPEGNAYVWEFVTVSRFSPDGLLLQLEGFDGDGWEEALAVFDGWARDSR